MFDSAAQQFDQTGAATGRNFLDGKALREVGSKMQSAPQGRLTSAELFDLQRRFDRFILTLNPPKTRKT